LGGHGSCPICRNVFLSIVETSSEPESSDGDYIPSSDFGHEGSEVYDSDWMDADQDWEDEADVDIEEEQQNEGKEDFGLEERQDAPIGEVVGYVGHDHSDDDDPIFTDDFWDMNDSDAGAYGEDEDGLESNVSNPICSLLNAFQRVSRLLFEYEYE
jgi:hypothetical protein